MKLVSNLGNLLIQRKLSLNQLLSIACKSCGVDYIQGQEFNKTRQYFYYIDHNGMLFLDDSRMKNFTSCFKDKQFLQFFFKRIAINKTGQYEHDFPYVSLCGRETNYIRCDDLPIVFTHIITKDDIDVLSYGYTDDLLTVPFEPQTLYMKIDFGIDVNETEGRIYHKSMDKLGGIGLIRSALALGISKHFQFNDNSKSPTHFVWKEKTYELTNELKSKFK
ncbi:UPF0598 protein CG30010-like [Oppia nitens]|uniref:UPF0598 protein CG30010-like n=1 Tax=Oppia nitens TaxID=1686743 RepID=UPI0023DB5818|nr:UPF0598 protein CG30010-like [Oppia nitens]